MNSIKQFQCLLFFMLAFTLIFSFFELLYGVIVLVFFTLVNGYFLKTKLCKDNSYKFLQLFFVGVVILTLLILSFNFIALNDIFTFAPIYFFLVGLYIISFIMLFKFLARKHLPIGIVLDSTKDYAIVKLDYDFPTGLSEGTYAVENTIKAKKGQKVKLKTQKPLFSKVKPVSIESE